MKIRVHICPCGPNHVSVHCQPSWWERLLGRRVLDDEATYVGGSAQWIWDSTGRRIRSRRVLEAIDLAVEQHETAATHS